jgi:hypothetical protein
MCFVLVLETLFPHGYLIARRLSARDLETRVYGIERRESVYIESTYQAQCVGVLKK